MAHIQSCDPVITDGEYAYVTLRGGTSCCFFFKQKKAYDVKNVFSPWLVQEYPMLEPHGLTKVGSDVYVCDGSDGWEKMDDNERYKVHTTYFIENLHACVLYYTFYNNLYISEIDVRCQDI